MIKVVFKITGLIFSVFIILVVIFIIYKMISGKGAPDNSYTPFDYITGQSNTDFKEEKDEDPKGD